MKMRSLFMAVSLCVLCFGKVKAQSQEMQQLILNIEKLAQFKAILEDMKKGYEVLSKGYNAVKDISAGNFSLHKVFLDGLMEVSPAVRSCKRIAQTVNYQLAIVNEHRKAMHEFQASAVFDDWEIDYISRVYKKLFNESLECLEDLLTVITSGRLRMSDEERLKEIDAIYYKMQEKFVFLRSFNRSTAILSLQRKKEQHDVRVMKGYYGEK